MLNKFAKRNFGHLAKSVKSTQLASSNNKLHLSGKKSWSTNGNETPTITHTQHKFGSNQILFHFKINSKVTTPRPTNFVFAIDSSGSMSGSCAHSSNTDPEVDKFSRMDLVKHSANLVMECLRPEDTLSLVTFSSSASKLLRLTHMSVTEKASAKQIISNLHPDEMTNMWDGMKLSMDELNTVANLKGKNNFAVTFTDGVPNITPPNGEYNQFIEKITREGLSYSFNNFAYGYDLNSKLLSDISNGGGGLFAHIPDYSMCNTVFINFLGNCLATTVNKVKLRVQSRDGCNAVSVLGSTELKTNKKDGRDTSLNYVDLGSVKSEQQRNILVVANIVDPKNFNMMFNFDMDGTSVDYPVSNQDYTNDNFLNDNDTSYNVAKHNLMNIIRTGIDSKTLIELDDTTCRLANFVATIRKFTANSTNQNDDFCNKIDQLLLNVQSNDNLQGQVMKAFSNEEWFNRWGKHYLRYLHSSLYLEECSNFKDTALQHYGGPLFRDLRTEIEDIFSNIPVPKPSRSTSNFSGNFQQTFYSPSGPCFAGDGFVSMADGSHKLVQDIVKGDQVSSNGNIATVVCVLKTKIKGSYALMSNFSGLKVSPWHPICLKGKWVFPTEVQPSKQTKCDYFYDFVLDNHHIVTINGIKTICLGHGFTHDPVLKHDFFGTDKVINELKKDKKGWERGLVEIHDYNPVYKNGNSKTGLVDGFSLEKKPYHNSYVDGYIDSYIDNNILHVNPVETLVDVVTSGVNSATNVINSVANTAMHTKLQNKTNDAFDKFDTLSDSADISPEVSTDIVTDIINVGSAVGDAVVEVGGAVVDTVSSVKDL